MSIPFLRILQTLSPSCVEGEAEYNAKAKPGMFINSVTGELYGKSINVIPIKREVLWLEWKPKRGGLVNRHLPESIVVDKSDFTDWKAPNGNSIVETMNYYCLVEGRLKDGIIVLSLTSTGVKHAKTWNTYLANTKTESGAVAPIFGAVWKLETALNKNESGSWYTIGTKTANISKIRLITKEEYVGYVAGYFEAAKSVKELDYTSAEGRLLEDKSKTPDYTQY
jgi:hypothetical protein